MRTGVLLSLLLFVAGCGRAPVIDRSAFDQHYEESALAQDVLSAVPLRIDPDQPPTVVNWWYAGTDSSWHYLVKRELTWDSKGKPVGREQRYRLIPSELDITKPFARTRDDARWMPLHEAVRGLEPPSDLPTTRRLPDPVRRDVVQPEALQPDDGSPRPVKPGEQ